MGRRDQVDDREAEPGAALAAGLVGAAEALERPLEEAGRKARAVVADVQLDAPVRRARPEPDRALAVAERVLDQVVERLLEPQPVAGEDDRAAVDLEAAAGLVGAHGEAAGDRLEQRARLDLLPPELQLALLPPREQQQVLGDPGEPVGLDRGGAERLLELGDRPLPPQRQVELRPQQRERRPQLVARVGDEAALVLDGGLDPRQHLVQRPAEPGDLVLAGRHGQPAPGRLGGDPGGLAAHLVDRPERGAGEPPAGERGEQERDRARDEELGQETRDGLVLRLERRRDRDDAAVDAPGPGGDPPVARAAGQMPFEQQRLPGRRPLPAPARDEHRAGAADDPPRGPEHLREPARAGIEQLAPLRAVPPRLVELGPERPVERADELPVDPEHDGRAHRREHRRHHGREDERQPEPEREPAHSRASR